MRRIESGIEAEAKDQSGLQEAAAQLALDEALLIAADEDGIGPSFRIWELSRPTVVLGRSSKVDRETDRAFCAAGGIPIVRRCTGGASIVAGPGCLMYSVVLSIEQHPELAKVDAAHRHVMDRVLAAARRQVPAARREGVCDLTLAGRKFSGNALRIARRHVLYHGTILYAGDLALIAKCLDFAPRQPEYRGGRSHGEFITNATLRPDRFADDLASQWNAAPGDPPPEVFDRARELASKRYGCDDWHYRH